ncbi:hypothetical protein BDQ12DRAFT_674099 [Crucibulum laeve]|uniref:Uncharacterized protein n=1 Tax=Crucibulum laeve TaxID=68775 RepID=A0A5C3MK66_9AGAR|nr:hypothetical protein BDQ12DRAFT_674099 [Crucibulum laeve]
MHCTQAPSIRPRIIILPKQDLKGKLGNTGDENSRADTPRTIRSTFIQSYTGSSNTTIKAAMKNRNNTTTQRSCTRISRTMKRKASSTQAQAKKQPLQDITMQILGQAASAHPVGSSSSTSRSRPLVPITHQRGATVTRLPYMQTQGQVHHQLLHRASNPNPFRSSLPPSSPPPYTSSLTQSATNAPSIPSFLSNLPNPSSITSHPSPPPDTNSILGYNGISEDYEPPDAWDEFVLPVARTSLDLKWHESIEDADADLFGILALEEKLKAGREGLARGVGVELPVVRREGHPDGRVRVHGLEWVSVQRAGKTMLKQASGARSSSSARSSIQKKAARKSVAARKAVKEEKDRTERLAQERYHEDAVPNGTRKIKQVTSGTGGEEDHIDDKGHYYSICSESNSNDGFDTSSVRSTGPTHLSRITSTANGMGNNTNKYNKTDITTKCREINSVSNRIRAESADAVEGEIKLRKSAGKECNVKIETTKQRLDRERKERIAYFKKLESYKLTKENVYIV